MAQKHVVIAIPAYSSTAYLATFRSLINDIVTLIQRGDLVTVIDNCGSAYIDDTRARIVHEFLKGTGTDLVSIDHDLVWEPGALVRIVDAPVDMCAGIYRKREESVEFPIRYLEHGAELWADPETGLLEVAGVPFGLVKCSRSMLERMTEKYQDLVIEWANGELICLLFECLRNGKVRLHEDFAFCERWREMGGKVWVDPEILTAHIGLKPYVGNFGSYLRKEAGLTFPYCLGQIARGVDNKNTHIELIEAWGNGNWSCGDKSQQMIADLARKADGPIVEFGSGLSTVIMRAATDQPITVFEQDAEWAAKVQERLTGPVQMCVAELDGDFYYTAGLYDRHYALAICDGPMKYTAVARGGVYPVLDRVLKPGAAFMVDDLQINGAVEKLKEWAEGKADFEIFENDTRKFAVGKLRA